VNGLAAFYAARLDEAEAAAKACQSPSPWKAATHEAFSVIVKDGAGDALIYDEGTPSLEEAAHIARHDPARVLRDVAAGRAILAEYDEAAQSPYDLPEGVSEGRDDDERERDAYLIDVLDGVVRHLAAVHSDHPDYDPGWAP
jgi:hypothetical protein